MSLDPEEAIRVGIGLIGRSGRYLIRQRPAGTAMAGRWEFPGGKCELYESAKEATARECFEEVGIKVVVGDLFHHVIYHYPHGLIDLHYYRCSIEAGSEREPSADSGFRWVPAGELSDYDFPEANDAVIAALARESVVTRGTLQDET